MKTEILNVNGMNCAHCEKAVMDAVLEFDGVSEVKASASEKKVTVVFDETKVTLDMIADAIDEEGFEVIK